MKPIIYSMTFASGASYIGATTNFKVRRKQHRRDLRRGQGINRKAQAEFAAHGPPTFQEIASLKNGELQELEALVITQMQPPLNVVGLAAPAVFEGRPRQFGPYASVKDFASAVGLTYKTAQRMSRKYSYDACIYKLAYQPAKRRNKCQPLQST